MGNNIKNVDKLEINNFRLRTYHGLTICQNDIKLDKDSIKKAKQRMQNISKHNKDGKDNDLIENCLLNHPLFCSLEKQARSEVVHQMSQYFVKSGVELFKQGEHPAYFYIISEGECEMRINGKLIQTLKKGSSFGEISLIYNCNRECTIKSIKDCYFWTLEKKNFKKIIEHILNINFEENKKNIGDIPFFSGFNTEIRSKILNNLYKETYLGNKIIFKRNQVPYCIYFIKEGKVDVKYNDKIIYTLNKGDYFGELSLLAKSNRVFEHVSKDKCILFSVPVSFMYEMVGSKYPIELCLNIIKSAFINVPRLSRFNVKFFNDIFYLFSLDYYEKEEVILRENTKKNEFIIIPIEGYLINSKTGKIICKRGELFLGDSIYNDDNSPIEYIVKCCPYSLIAKTKTVYALSTLRCSFKESIDKSSSMQQLKKVNLFKSLNENKLEDIFRKIKFEKISDGQNIITQGEEGTRFYILKKGLIDVFINDNHYKTVSQNVYFGERSLFFKEPRTMTCKAKGDCELFYLEKEDFDNVIEKNLKEYLKDRLYLQDDSIQLSDLSYYKNLGQGSYGNVSLVKSERNKYFYAIKNISNKQILYSKISKNIELERQILLQIDHPFIVKLIKTFKDDKYIYYLMDYIKGKVLYKVIREIGLLSKSLAQFYIGSIILAVKYLHEKYIIFRDIKPENIIIVENGFIKIIDFSAAKILKDKSTTIIGTPPYMAPEIILGDEYSFEIDYWSIGVCLYEFVYGDYPFGNDADEVIEIYSAIINE